MFASISKKLRLSSLWSESQPRKAISNFVWASVAIWRDSLCGQICFNFVELDFLCGNGPIVFFNLIISGSELFFLSVLGNKLNPNWLSRACFVSEAPRTHSKVSGDISFLKSFDCSQTFRRFSFSPAFLFFVVVGVQCVLRQLFETLSTDFAQNSNISSRFQKWGATFSQVCRAALIRPALESSDPDASNGGPNVGVWVFGADLITFEKAELTK